MLLMLYNLLFVLTMFVCITTSLDIDINSHIISSSSLLLLRSNESEFLALQGLQANSLLTLKAFTYQTIRSSFHYRSLPHVFLQQENLYPSSNQQQLPNFGATTSWKKIRESIERNSSRRLLIMIRHAQAWENLNPLGNDECIFPLNDGQLIDNFDSDLSDDGVKQAELLHDLLSNVSYQEPNEKWFDTLGLSSSNAYLFSSPLTRTMRTTAIGLSGLTNKSVVVSEMLRASIGTDVCNYRRSVFSLTSDNELPTPFNSGCQLPNDSLSSIYSNGHIKFAFPIRPAGGLGIGLISDNEQLWRSDIVDDSHDARARVFIQQIFDFTAPGAIIGVVTHGEMIDAFYRVTGNKDGYGPLNTQIVPLIIEAC